EKLKIKHIAINLEIIKKNLTAKIEKISVDKDQVKPGDKLNLQIALKPYNGKVLNKEVKFQVPFNLKKGWIKLAVSGGTDYDELRKNLFLEKPKIFEVSQILKNLTYSEKQNDLIVKLVLPRDDIIIKGERLIHLPNFFRNILDSLPTTLVDYDKETYTEIITTPWIVSGWKVINLEIKEDIKDNKENKVSSNLDIFFTSSKVDSPGKGKSEEEKQTENIFESKSLALNNLSDFLEGDFIGTSINEYGMLSLAPKDEVIFTLKEGFINNVVSDLKHNLIYFSDFEGKIYKIDSQGRFKDFIKLPELIISALKIDLKGNLLALTLPKGKFYKITPQGEIAFSHQFKENYLWSLALDSNDNIFIGTGLPGRIYKINSKELIFLFCDLKEEHINNLIFDSSGNLYAATSDRGVIYKVNSQGEFGAIFSTFPDDIETILPDKENLYISAGGNIYKLNLISKKTKKFKFYNKLNLCLTKVKDGILAGSFQKGKLYKILENEELIRLYDFKATGVIGILPFGEDLLVATLNPNKLIKIKSKFSREGLFFSNILDLGMESKFGNISFNASSEKNTNVILQTRSGNTPLIDSSWSDWSREYTNKQGEKIASPQARFLQIKAKLAALDEDETPTLYQIKFFYKNLKFPPRLKFINPDGINIFKDKVNLKWEVQDADFDNLAFELYYKKKEELNWEPIILNLKAKFKKELKEKKSELYQEEFLWETMKVPDGEYYLKLISYDYTDENNQSLKFQIISKPLIICNTPPELKGILVSLENNELIIKGKAKSKLLNIKSVFFKINNQDEISALPADGLWDSNEEDFLIKFKFKEKPNFIKIYAEDEAGNESAWDKKF
ncbi:MAG: hypothetical protein HYU63_02695, partial [Armatimonadetes bacterium]|nr:hypothetical protein [Armatimonadota bacterium]